MERQLKGKRTWKDMTKFKKYKTAIRHDPWKKRGIDDRNRPGAWAPNAISTAKRKAKKHLGIERMSRKDVTYFHRVRWLMRETGATHKGVKVSWSKKKSQFAISVKAVGNRYAYMHLYGKPGMFPARPWGVWTFQDIRYLEKLLIKWGTNLGKAA
jgi:hypothetical protein